MTQTTISSDVIGSRNHVTLDVWRGFWEHLPRIEGKYRLYVESLMICSAYKGSELGCYD